MSRGIIWRTLHAPAHQQGDISVTPVARAVGFRWRKGGWLWLFPVAVEVRHHAADPDAQDERPARLAIFDVTRLILILFVAGTLLALILLRRRANRRREQHAIRN